HLPGTAMATTLAPDGSAWVAGRTGTDAYVARIDAAGATTFMKTFGGAGDDEARGIALRGSAVYIAGATTSPDFHGTLNLGGRDGFVVKIDVATGAVVFARTIGGVGDDEATAIALSDGDVVVAGTTRSVDLPVSRGSLDGASDAFLARLDATDGSLRF